jgi:hypothetical protein
MSSVFTSSLALLGALCSVVGCGGRQLGYLSEAGSYEAGEAGDDGNSTSDGEVVPDTSFGEETSSLPDAPITTTPDAEIDARVTCIPGTSVGGGGSNGSCTTMMSETCSDGTTYTVDCSCPRATCNCSREMGSTGEGTLGAHYEGCSQFCSVAMDAWDACNFPH